MQLKIKRSQRASQGLVASKLLYVLDARAELTPEEATAAQRYGLMGQVIYNSKASEEALGKSKVHLEQGGWKGSFASLAYTALAAMNLNITINGLVKGTHIECKDMDELLGAEEAIITACKNLRTYLELARTFDGREVILDFTTEEPQVIAPGAVVKPPQVSSPQSAAAPTLANMPVSPAPAMPPVSPPPSLMPKVAGDIPPVPAEADAAPPPAALDDTPPANTEPAQVREPSVQPGSPTGAGMAPANPVGLPPVPPINAPLVPDVGVDPPQASYLSGGGYAAAEDRLPPNLTELWPRAREAFARLDPMQKLGVTVAGLVILMIILSKL